jgi:LPXTG-motif cell wall-anchored protein
MFQSIWEFMQSWYFIGIMAVLLIALIGLFFFLRNRQSED